MSEEVAVEEVAPLRMAATRVRARLAEFPALMSRLFGDAMGCLQDQGQAPGRTAVFIESITPNESGEMVFDMWVGVEAASEFAARGAVERVFTPGGPAAHLVYVGPYEGLFGAHEGMEKWLAGHGYSAGRRWELYTEPTVANGQPRTDIYYQLPAAGKGGAPSGR